MKVLCSIDRYFSFCLVGAIAMGVLLPKLQHFQDCVLYIIMAILTLTFLKTNIADVLIHMRKPFRVLYLVILNMVIIPILTFVIFEPLDPELIMGLVLLAALPTGVSSATFTDIMKGKTCLTLLIIIVGTLLAPFSIPALFYVLYRNTLPLDYLGLFQNLLIIILIPMALSQLIKILFEDMVTKVQSYINSVVIFLLSFMIAIVMAIKSEEILCNLSSTFELLGILFIMFIVFQLVGYFGCFWLKKGEKVAVANSTTIMNNTLGIVLALAFFGPKVEMLVILSIIPWNFMIIIFHWYKRLLP